MHTLYKNRDHWKRHCATALICLVAASICAPAGPVTPDSPQDCNAVASEKAGARAPAVKVTVDPRVELMSIIFRLAGNLEYNKGRMVSYISQVKDHFGSHRDHPVVKLAAELRKRRGVSYDAPMSLAVHIDSIHRLQLRVPLKPRPAWLDGRWQDDELREFLEKTRDFKKEAAFDEFFRENSLLYEDSTGRLQKVLDKDGHLEWFDEFFGAAPGASFHISISIINGPSCYGPRVKLADKQEFHCILGAWKCGILGMGKPQFDRDMLSTVVHEFCHSYANPVVDARVDEIRTAGERIFPAVQKKMKRMAYGNWQTMMYESLVRACVIQYLADTWDQNKAEQQIKSDVERGFLWMRELAGLLSEYKEHRDKYPTLDAFFPRIKEFFDGYEMP